MLAHDERGSVTTMMAIRSPAFTPSAASPPRTPGTARMGSMLSHGLDGQMMMPASAGSASAAFTAAVRIGERGLRQLVEHTEASVGSALAVGRRHQHT